MTDDLTYHKMKTWLALRDNQVPINFECGEDGLSQSLQHYYELGLEPGGMLYSVLINDVHGGYQRCHPLIKSWYGDLITFILDELPKYCYGSPEKVEDWLSHNGIQGVSEDFEWQCPYTMTESKWSKYYIPGSY